MSDDIEKVVATIAFLIDEEENEMLGKMISLGGRLVILQNKRGEKRKVVLLPQDEVKAKAVAEIYLQFNVARSLDVLNADKMSAEDRENKRVEILAWYQKHLMA